MAQFTVHGALITPTATQPAHPFSELVEATTWEQAVELVAESLAEQMAAGEVYNYWVMGALGTRRWGWEPDEEDDYQG